MPDRREISIPLTSKGHAPSPAYADNFAYEPATVRERHLAIGLSSALTLGTLAIAPFARIALTPQPAFLLLIEAIAMVALLLSGSTLYSQYRARCYVPLALLGIGFAAYGLTHLLYILTFPGVFSPTGQLGASPQSASWMFVVGRMLFAFTVVAFAYAEWRERCDRGLDNAVIVRFSSTAFAIVAALALFVTVGHRFLPTLVLANGVYSTYFTNTVQPVLVATSTLGLVALIAVAGFRTRVSVWLSVALFVQILELITAGSLANQRFSVGWYVARVDLTVSSILFIVAMQAQLAGILLRAAQASTRAHTLFRISSTETGSARQTNQRLVENALSELDFEWGFVTRIEEGHVTIETSVGATPPERDMRSRMETSLLHGVTGRELFIMESTTTQTGTSQMQWGAFASIPIFVDGKLYGAAGFASRKKRKAPINDADRDFMYLLGILTASAIDREQRSQRLNGLAFYDSLTGLANRAQLLEKLTERLAAGQRYGTPFAVHFIDLDYFKAINDRYGHAVGDEVLREVGTRLRTSVREEDIVARLGGDEFVLLQKLDSSDREAETLRGRILASLEKTIVTTAAPISIGASIGIALYPTDGNDAQALLSAADQAQYRVKNRRRWTTNETKADGKRVVALERRNVANG